MYYIPVSWYSSWGFPIGHFCVWCILWPDARWQIILCVQDGICHAWGKWNGLWVFFRFKLVPLIHIVASRWFISVGKCFYFFYSTVKTVSSCEIGKTLSNINPDDQNIDVAEVGHRLCGTCRDILFFCFLDEAEYPRHMQSCLLVLLLLLLSILRKGKLHLVVTFQLGRLFVIKDSDYRRLPKKYTSTRNINNLF